MRIAAHLATSTLLFATAFLLGSTAVEAQVRHPGQPAATRLADASLPQILVSPPDVAALLSEDADHAARGVIGPLRFGVPLSVPFVFEQAAGWQVSVDGELLVARLEIRAPGAYSLGIEWAEYDLPADGQLFLYDPDLQTVLGAYTQEERIPTGEFVVEPLAGDRVVLEYSQPAQSESLPHMAIRSVIYDYKNVFEIERLLDTFGGGGSSYTGSCDFVNVNCPEGDPFPLQKRSTVRTIYGGGLCSGSLINNTQNDETRYLYTANHCGQGSTTVVRFNYQNANCGGGSAPTNQNVSGAVLLANDVDTDGRFLRLTGNIPDSYNPFYAGWSRSNANLTFAVSMHHPGGGPKKISIDNNGGGMTTGNFIGIGTVKVWDINSQVGVTAGGSSGGPLFDENGRLRGALTGGPDVPCTVALYGRFHNFWNDVGLGTWLDPTSSGVQAIDGYDPFADVAPPNLTTILPASGPAGGFSQVTLGGTGLDGVVSVTFDGVEAKSFTEVSTNAVLVVTPGGTLGATVDVVLTDSMGSSTLVNGFTFTANPAPDIALVTPDKGGVAGGTLVTITGPSMVGVTDVQFGGVSGTELDVLDAGTLEVRTPASAGPGSVDVTAFGNGSDTIVSGFSYTVPGSFTVIGPGHPGFLGLTPNLSGSGDLIPGGAGFTLTTSSIAPSAAGVLFISLAQASVPFKGGTLYTVPILFSLPIQATFLGVVQIPVALDPGFPSGVEIFVQQAFADAAASKGASLSNGLKITIGSN